MSHDVHLLIDGQRFGGWKQIAIDRGIETASNAFELSVTERWAGQDVARPIRPGAACRVEVDHQVVITGYVDDIAIAHGPEDHTVTVRGRDMTGDLVDCSAIHRTGSWRGVTLGQLAEDLARPFGVRVIVETDVGAPFPDWQIQEGETVFECVERGARMRGVLVTTDGTGALVLTRAGTAHCGVTVRLGENLLAASGTFTQRDRHSEYRVKGTMPGADETTPEQHAAPVARIADAGISRYRPLVIVAEDNGDPAVFATRATWERNVRFGRAARLDATVAGWYAGRSLWAPNQLVRYEDAFMGLAEDLLIAAVRMSVSEAGFLSQLTLTRREAFDVEPLPADKAKAAAAGAGTAQLTGDLAWTWATQ